MLPIGYCCLSHVYIDSEKGWKVKNVNIFIDFKCKFLFFKSAYFFEVKQEFSILEWVEDIPHVINNLLDIHCFFLNLLL